MSGDLQVDGGAAGDGALGGAGAVAGVEDPLGVPTRFQVTTTEGQTGHRCLVAVGPDNDV